MNERGGLRVLMISSDRLVLTKGSFVSERMKDYGKLVDELNIVLLCDKDHDLTKADLSPNVHVFPTNSSNRFFRPLDAVRIGSRISSTLITAQDPFECGWAGKRLKKLKDIPLEVQLHTDPFSKNFGGLLNGIRKLIAPSVLEEADGIRVVLRSVGEKMIEKFGIEREKVTVLPIYIDRSRISAELTCNLHDRYEFETIAITVSRLSKEKDIDMAIRAVSEVPDVGLVIVGTGPEEERLRELARKLNVKSRVFFAGWLEDLSCHYGTADIFVQTSKFEGYGLSLVEAGLTGLPVISTSTGIANDLENIVIADSVGELVERLRELSADPDKRKMIGSELRRELEAEVYTKEAYLTKLKENWVKLVNKHV